MCVRNSRNKRGLFVLLLSCLLVLAASVSASAQYYNIGNEPAGLRWWQIKSKNFRIIYPESRLLRESDTSVSINTYTALQYLKQMEQYYGVLADSIGYNYGLSRRFPLVLHPYNANSNGVTVWAPRQIDFYGIPTPELISVDCWDQSLTSHEGRHAWQMAHFNRGVFKGLYWIFGDQAIGMASGIYPSRWMLEGDAVVAETEVGHGGRGRNGAFLSKALSTIAIDTQYFANKGIKLAPYNGAYGKPRSWDRYRLGSVKYQTLGPYPLGYMINSMARYKTGDYNLAHKIFSYEPLHFMSANVVASAFKEYTGHSHRDFVKGDLLQEFYYLNTNWPVKLMLDSVKREQVKMYGEGSLLSARAQKADKLKFTDVEKRSGFHKDYYTSFSNIAEVGRDSVLVVVTGYGTAPYLALYYLDGVWNTKILRYFNGSVTGLVKVGDKVYFSEIIGDARWGQIAHSKLFAYSLQNGSIERIETGDRNLYKPFVVNDVLYAIEYVPYDVQLRSSLTPVLNTVTGENLLEGSKTVSPEKYILTGQVTSACSLGGKIYYTLLNEAGVGLYCVSGETVIAPMSHIISELTADGERFYFISDYTGSNRLLSLKPGELNAKGEPDIRFASASDYILKAEPSAYTDSAQYVYILKNTEERGVLPYKERVTDIPLTSEMEFDFPLAQELSRQRDAELIARETKSHAGDTIKEEIEISRYRSLPHLFKIHSWAPVYMDINSATAGSFDDFYDDAQTGVSIYSQNNQGTASGMLGYSFERTSPSGFLPKKNLHAAHAKFTYKGWFPVLEASAHFNDKYMREEGKHSWRTYFGAYIPLTFNSHGWSRGITPQLMWSYRNDEEVIDVNNGSYPGLYTVRQKGRHQIRASLSMFSSLPKSTAQVFPRLGIGTQLNAGFNPDGGKYFGSIYSAYFYGYLPGFAFNQALKLSAAWQYQDIAGKLYYTDNIISMPRGYTEKFYGKQYLRVTADYAVPAYLGDVSLGLFAYLKRLDVIPFIDYGCVKFKRDGQERWHARYSFGTDILFNGHFFRIGFPIQIGVRYAHTNKPGDIGNSVTGPSGNYTGNGRKDYFGLLFGIAFQ